MGTRLLLWPVGAAGRLTHVGHAMDAPEGSRARGGVTTLDTLLSSVLERGEARGGAERERELVLSLIEDGGMSIARIAKVTSLTVEEVLDIARGADEPS